MNADSAFFIGKNHTICEDYAMAGVENDLAYAIVCDGCSASPDVDFGARALAFSAKRAILLGGLLPNTSLSSDGFGNATIQNARRVFDIFPQLHPQALDTTVLAAWIQNNKLTAYLYGDGVFIHKYEDKIDFVHISLSSGAPDYLSYWLDKSRREGYNKLIDNQKIITTTYHAPSLQTLRPFDPVEIECGVREGDVITLMSDGVNSFRKSDNTPIDWREIAKEFTDFKSFPGVFALRTLSAFKRKCLKEGLTHSDDISIASIVV